MHIPFVCMVKLKLLAHFPVDHLADLVVTRLILLLCYFAAFAYYVIDGFVLSILALIWLILMALSCAAIRRDSISLLRFPFLSQVQVFWCEMVFISRLKLPSHFCSLVVVILSSIVLSVSFLMAVISPRSCFSI